MCLFMQRYSIQAKNTSNITSILESFYTTTILIMSSLITTTLLIMSILITLNTGDNTYNDITYYRFY